MRHMVLVEHYSTLCMKSNRAISHTNFNMSKLNTFSCIWVAATSKKRCALKTNKKNPRLITVEDLFKIRAWQ